jgi:hypothetical protein
MNKKRLTQKTVIKKLEELELIGVTDITRLLHWGAPKITTYIKRGVLPEPIAEISGRPVWYMPDILDYAEMNGIPTYDINEEWEDPYKRNERKKKESSLAS